MAMKTTYKVEGDGDAVQVTFFYGNHQLAGMIIPISPFGEDEVYQLACGFGEYFEHVVRVRKPPRPKWQQRK